MEKKQYPKVNGGIIVMEPFNGNVALVGGLILKKVSLIESLKLRDNQDLLLNQLYMLLL